MSHELRTPLNAVIGFSEVLLERMFGDINERSTRRMPSRSRRRTTPTCSAPSSPSGRCAGPTGRACACASTACSKRAAIGRPGGARRAGRGRVAARDPQRSVAQPADAPELGLDLPERRIGLSAHDFAQTLGARRGLLAPVRPGYPARRRSPRVSCSGWPRSAGEKRWDTALERGGRDTWPGRASSIGRQRGAAAGAAARAEARA